MYIVYIYREYNERQWPSDIVHHHVLELVCNDKLLNQYTCEIVESINDCVYIVLIVDYASLNK